MASEDRMHKETEERHYERMNAMAEERSDYRVRELREHQLRLGAAIGWFVIALAALWVVYQLGIHFSETRRQVATQRALEIEAKRTFDFGVSPRLSWDSVLASDQTSSKQSAQVLSIASQVTIQRAVETAYPLGDKSNTTLPIDEIVKIVQQFLDWGAIPKDAANGLIKELKDFAKPIAIDAAKMLLAKYLGGQPAGPASAMGHEQFSGPGFPQLICNSFNTVPVQAAPIQPIPKVPKRKKTEPLPRCTSSLPEKAAN